VTATAARKIPPWSARFKEALLAAVVAGVLAIPLIGLHAVDGAQGLGIDTRFGVVAIGASFVFVGRL
jgi:hypothetical protein